MGQEGDCLEERISRSGDFSTIYSAQWEKITKADIQEKIKPLPERSQRHSTLFLLTSKGRIQIDLLPLGTEGHYFAVNFSTIHRVTTITI